MSYQTPGGAPPPQPPPWQPPRRGVSTGAAVGIIAGAVAVIAAVVAVVIVTAGGGEPASPGDARATCGQVTEEPATLGPSHLEPGEPLPQTERPASSGPHAGSTLDAGVYTSPVDEAQAIHNLEHGYVVIWYDPEAVSQDVVAALGSAAQGNRVVMAPYDLQDEGVVFVSWERRRRCDPGVDAATAQAAAADYIATYVDSPNAPEAGVG